MALARERGRRVFWRSDRGARAGRGETHGARETRETSEWRCVSGYQKGGAAQAVHVLTLQ